MKDYELFQLIKPIVDAGLAAAGLTGVQLTQSYQPTIQGVEPLTQVFMQKIASKRYGWLERKDVWNADTDVFDHVESQRMETTFQMGAMTIMKPKQTTQLSSSDILDIVASTLQSDATLVTLKNAGVLILRITDISNPFFRNDEDNYEASPSFDFTLTHKQDRISTTPNASPVEGDIYPV